MWLELLILVLGLAFGFLKRGKENLWELFKTGAVVGIIVGVVFAAILMITGMGFVGGLTGGGGLLAGVVLYFIIFIVGVFIGDLLEKALRKRA